MAFITRIFNFIFVNLILYSSYIQAFSYRSSSKNVNILSTSRIFSGKGFGTPEKTPAEIAMERSYDASENFADDIVNVESAMKNFFESHEEWIPLFRKIQGDKPQASTFVGSADDSELVFDTNNPWKKFPEFSNDEDEKKVVASFLDTMQASLLDIPVNEKVEEDSADVHFIEEGRRLLCLTRFQVLNVQKEASDDRLMYDSELFRTCWSEIYTLIDENKENTGSLILIRDTSVSANDLVRYADMNLFRPLEWLGLGKVLEVSPIHKGDCRGIRILHKLGDIPDLDEREDNE